MYLLYTTTPWDIRWTRVAQWSHVVPINVYRLGVYAAVGSTLAGGSMRLGCLVLED